MQPSIAANITLLLQLLAMSERHKQQRPVNLLAHVQQVPDNGCRLDVYEPDICEAQEDDAQAPEMPIWYGRPRRNGLRCAKWLWPEGLVPYEVRIEDEEVQKRFFEAVDELNALKCVKFEPRAEDHEGKYLMVEETAPIVGRSCAATAGASPPQPRLYVSSKCTKGKILHELMHVLGFAHEHQRPDRDEYVRVMCDNIMSNVTNDFRKLKRGVTDAFGEPYDFYSLMHYRVDHFTKNGQATLVPLDPTVDPAKVGLMEKLSESDTRKVKHMYNCPV